MSCPGEDRHPVDDAHLQPLEMARVELTLKVMPSGRRAIGFYAATPEGEVPQLFDLHGMLSYALATIGDPDWLATAYHYDDED